MLFRLDSQSNVQIALLHASKTYIRLAASTRDVRPVEAAFPAPTLMASITVLTKVAYSDDVVSKLSANRY